MTEKDSPLVLLGLAAEIARAGQDPQRWPEVFDRLGDSLSCTTVFAHPKRDQTQPPAVIVRAANCAREGTGPCSCEPTLDERKRQTCLALVEHLDLAARAAGTHPPSRHSFDDLPRPIYLVDSKGMLLDANASGVRLLDDNPWLTVQDGCLQPIVKGEQQALMGALSTLSQAKGRETVCQPLASRQGQSAELWLRRLSREDDPDRGFLVSLIVHDRIPVSDRLSPRQQELATHLLAGRSLTDAATQMGIARRTAKDHLTALFHLSQTRRQADLLAWLTRQHLV